MVRLNKNTLTEKQLNNLFKQFVTIVAPKQPTESTRILKEILGSEEQIMIAKRIAIIVLLLEGKSLYAISNMLKISPSTAEKVQNNLANDCYEAIIQRLHHSKKDYFAILNTIDSILHLGGILPHYNGPDRSHRRY